MASDAGGRLAGVAQIDGITQLESCVLEALEPGHMPLWELGDDFVRGVVGAMPGTEQIAALLSPALAGLASYGLIEVRRFATWPAPWEQGPALDATDVASESRHLDHWSPNEIPRDVLAVNITRERIHWL